MAKQTKIDALQAVVKITIPLAHPGGYDMASAAIDSIAVPGATISVVSKALARISVPVVAPAADPVLAPPANQAAEETPSFLRKGK